MSGARFESLEDCNRHAVRVTISCVGCGHTRHLSANILMALFQSKPKDWRFATIAPRLVCYKCGRSKPDLSAFGHGNWY